MEEQNNPLEERVSRLEMELQTLAKRVQRVEQAAQAHTPQPVTTPASRLEPTPPIPPKTQAPATQMIFAPAPDQPRQAPASELLAGVKGPDWEAIVGGRWALWVGVAFSFLAVAFFLAYAWQFLGDWAKVAIGVLFGAAFLVIGEWTSDREKTFSASMTGGGLAILYLNTWAASDKYGILPFELALLGLAAVAALGVYLAVRYDTQALSLIATLGGFLAPAVLSPTGGPGGSVVPFLTYLLVLNAGILAVALHKRWVANQWLAFTALVLLLFGWSLDTGSSGAEWTVFLFFTLYYLTYAAVSIAPSFLKEVKPKETDALLFCSASVLYASAGQALLHNHLGSVPGAFLAIAALCEVGLAWWLYTRSESGEMLREAAVGIAALFATCALAAQLRSESLVIALSVEAAVLCWIAQRYTGKVLRYAAPTVWFIALLGVIWASLWSEGRAPLIVNPRALTVLAFALSSAVMVFLSDPKNEKKEPAAQAYGILAILAGAWFIMQEILLAFRLDYLPGLASTPGAPYYLTAVVWAVYSAGKYAGGLWMKRQPFRHSAVSVSALAAVLPFITTAAFPDLPDTVPAFWNLRLAAYLFASAGLAAIAWMGRRAETGPDTEERTAVGWLPLVSHAIVLWTATLAIMQAYHEGLFPDNPAPMMISITVWCVYAASLLVAGRAMETKRLRVFGYLVAGLAVLSLLEADVRTAGVTWMPVVNLRVMAFAALTILLAMCASGEGEADEIPVQRIALLAAPLVALWGLTHETWHFFWMNRESFGQWDRAAQVGISILWALSAVVLLVGGVWKEIRAVRLLGLALAGVTAVKVFVFDMASQDLPYRVLSFGGLGLALIGISWLYTRYGTGGDGDLLFHHQAGK